MKFKEYLIANLIDEIAMGPFGSNIKVSCFVDSGVPVLNGSNLDGFSLSESSFRYVTPEKADSLKKAIAHRGDIVITHRGTLGQIVYIPQSSKHDKYVISQSQFRVRCNDKVLPEYLVYYFHTPIGQHKLLSNASQVGVPALARPSSTFQQIQVCLPEVSEQRKVISIVNAIQDRIANNVAINDNLERQASALFKSWFIDFNQVPNCDFVNSEIGLIPNDWRVYKLSEFLPVITGKKNANVSSDKGAYPFFSCSQGISWTNDYSFDGHAILVAGNGDFNVKWYNGKFDAYQRTYVLIPYNKRFTSWLYYAVKYNLFNITSAARGSVIKFITKGNLENFAFAGPKDLDSLGVIDTFTTINHTMDKRTQENYRLSALRDALLPKLMSGEIDISAVQF